MFIPAILRKGEWDRAGGGVQYGGFVRAISLEKSNLIPQFSLLCCEMKFQWAISPYWLSMHFWGLFLEAGSVLFLCKQEQWKYRSFSEKVRNGIQIVLVKLQSCSMLFIISLPMSLAV